MTDSPGSRNFFPGDRFIWNLLKWTAPTDCQPVPVPAAVDAVVGVELLMLRAELKPISL
jgi:hypothetical protein